MRNQGGKRKRKAETNFVDAYSGASELAPPPTSKEVSAIPAKLRKIMELKSSSMKEQAAGKRPSVGNSRIKVENNRVGRKGGALNQPHGPTIGTPNQPQEKRSSTFASKWKKGEQQLKTLVEKLDRRANTGISPGVRERRKSFLNEKKKRKKGKARIPDEDDLPALHQHDKVEFGETVQAPPRLSFPRKAVEIKLKEKQKGEQPLLRERLRLEAIEAYRQRKEWSSRPGQKLPILNLTDAEI